jgi:dTDP-4-dehydrorhamnose reductase
MIAAQNCSAQEHVMMDAIRTSTALELWGGIECTRNRVGDSYFDQLEFSGHTRRPDDLDRVAELGIRTLRYPVLWERTAPHAPDRLDWAWADQRLERLRTLAIHPIVGFVHHGSGPVYTNLLDDSFATGVADFAGRLAARFPWVDAYTPIYEPLTTARFSALYGHWYPHARDGLSFARALLNQCRATVLAMQAIRRVNPGAKLIQTEDLGKSYGTSRLKYQVDHENERRWVTFDLLCGRVDRHTAMGDYLLWVGIAPDELAWFADHPCPPQMIGVNHYLTSERYLDEHLERYPAASCGNNGRDDYADVEAVRVLASGIAGPGKLLQEAWQRYHLPLAITEAHLGCTREEQLRWLWEVWQAAAATRAGGADVRAVTLWSILGAYDWDSLVTLSRGHYEPGAFDVRSGCPRPTAIAKLAAALARGQHPNMPVLNLRGWWHRPERLLYAGAEPAGRSGPTSPDNAPEARGVLIAGGNGTLGRALARVCAMRGLVVHALTRKQLDIGNSSDVERAIQRLQPWAVINAAGYVRVDDAERDRRTCLRDNVIGAANLARATAAASVPLVSFSTDLVFDGDRRAPYRESDSPRPLNTYGWSKARAERRIRRIHPKALIIRTSAFFGPWDQYNFLTVMRRELAAGRRFAAASDLLVSPTYVPDLAHAALDLLLDGAHGIWHLANDAQTTWAELARDVAKRAHLDDTLIEPRPAKTFGWPAARPVYSVLGSDNGAMLPTLDHALDRYLLELPSLPANLN